MFIADSDVLIDFLRGRGAAARVALELEQGLATTAISAFELWAGARGGRQERAVEELLAALDVLPLDATSSRRAARVRRALEAQGTTIGMADSLIAGIALERRAVLLTRNVRHFARVEDLSLASLDG